jgi:succinoglycan biosynthesis protein ExoM
VCICTYKRPHLLKRLLYELSRQETNGLFTYSIIVADNDASRSAESIITSFSAESRISVTYCVEPEQSISLARNKAIEHATGNFVAFIDDDEFPAKCWLLELFQACDGNDVGGVLGPVLRHFDEMPPQWVIKGNFYERPRHSTGFVIDWREGRTGNVLLKKLVFPSGESPFDPQFHRGGDVDFFRRMTEKGHVFTWCDEAIVYEVVPPTRWTRTFLIKRAFLRGTIALKRRPFRLRSIGKSVLAVPVYAFVLPFALVLGQHRFMNLLVRLCHHLGKLMPLVGLKPVKDEYVTD